MQLFGEWYFSLSSLKISHFGRLSDFRMCCQCQGAANKNALSISFSMESCGSPAVVAISGILMKDRKGGEEKLKTQALIQFNGEETWESQILTTDYYTRVKL